jgi:hypothetical protein
MMLAGALLRRTIPAAEDLKSQPEPNHKRELLSLQQAFGQGEMV